MTAVWGLFPAGFTGIGKGIETIFFEFLVMTNLVAGAFGDS